MLLDTEGPKAKEIHEALQEHSYALLFELDELTHALKGDSQGSAAVERRVVPLKRRDMFLIHDNARGITSRLAKDFSRIEESLL